MPRFPNIQKLLSATSSSQTKLMNAIADLDYALKNDDVEDVLLMLLVNQAFDCTTSGELQKCLAGSAVPYDADKLLKLFNKVGFKGPTSPHWDPRTETLTLKW